MARLKTEESRARSREIWEALPATAPAVAADMELHRSTIYRQLRLMEKHGMVERDGHTWHPVGALTDDSLVALWPRVGALGKVRAAYKLARRIADDYALPVEYRADMRQIRAALSYAEMALDH